MKTGFLTYAVVSVALTAGGTAYASFHLEWDRIMHWFGSGENRAALCVQFNDGAALETYVFGYRWEGAQNPTSRDILKAVASHGYIDILEQRTGRDTAGLTLAGLAFTPEQDALGDISFDFAAALNDSRLTFNYYAEDSSGKLIGPGDETPGLCANAIAEARGSHVIRHPIDAPTYGLAARDYDHWNMTGIDTSRHWNAGWNYGNWVMWSGNEDSGSMVYSGMGYASRRIGPDEVVVWNFNRHDGYPSDRDMIDGYTGATRPVRPLRYDFSAGTPSSLNEMTPEAGTETVWRTLTGIRVTPPLNPGIYVVTRNGSSKLILSTNHNL